MMFCGVNVWVIVGGVLLFPKFRVCHSNVRGTLSCGPFWGDNHLTAVKTVSPRFEWIPQIRVFTQNWGNGMNHWLLREITFESPRFEPFTYFGGWPSTCLLVTVIPAFRIPSPRGESIGEYCTKNAEKYESDVVVWIVPCPLVANDSYRWPATSFTNMV